MAGLSFADTVHGSRVIGNKIQTGAAYQMPEGWGNDLPTDQTWKMGGSEERCDWALLVLEPDKSLNLKKSQCSKRTYIQMFKKTEELVETLQSQSAENLKDLMGLSEKTAKSHAERFQSFHKLPPKQAALIFGGDGLRADDLSESEEKYMETHLRFVAGLYGVLRPFDDVKPVRDLPFGAKLATKRGDTVLDFWGDAISKQLLKDINPGGDRKPCMFLCCSDEYLRAVQNELFEKEGVKVVRICFEGAKDEETRKARATIGRWILRRKITFRDDLHDWEHEDWKLDKFKCSSSRVVFSSVAEVEAPKKDKKSKKGAAEKLEKAGKRVDDEGGGKDKNKKRKRDASPSQSAASGDASSESAGDRRSRRGEKRASTGRSGRAERGKSKSRSRGRRGGGRTEKGGGGRRRSPSS